MNTADAPSFSERVDRFLDWFLNVTPEVVVPPSSTPVRPKSRTVARRKPTGLRAKHSGPVRVGIKEKK